MKVRELLQTELWSKRTTRKILVGFAIVVVGFGVVFTVEVKWLTPGERVAAKQALASLDVLQNLNSGDEDFLKRTTQVHALIDVADQAAWTLRDDRIVTALRAYSDWLDFSRNLALMRGIEQRRQGGITDADRKQNGLDDATNLTVKVLGSGALHKVLD
jgi:hypothetical protein